MVKRNWWDELGSISGSHGLFCIRGDPLFAFRRNLVVLAGSKFPPGVGLFGRVSKYPYQKRSSHFCDPHAPHWAVSSRVWGIRACVPYPETHDRCNYPQTSSQTDSKTVPEQPPNDPRTTPTQPARAPAAGPSVGVVRGSFGFVRSSVLTPKRPPKQPPKRSQNVSTSPCSIC